MSPLSYLKLEVKYLKGGKMPNRIQIQQNIKISDIVAVSSLILGLPYTVYLIKNFGKSNNSLNNLYSFFSIIASGTSASLGAYHILHRIGKTPNIPKDDKELIALISSIP